MAICECYIFGKQHRQLFPKGEAWRSKRVLELVHTDGCGPMRTPSQSQNIYFILFIDYILRMTWVYFFKEKSKAFGIFKKYKLLVKNQSGCKIKNLRSDRGTEFNSKKFNVFCEEQGLEHQLTVAYTL